MSVEEHKITPGGFDTVRLPLLAASGAFLVYLFTLNPWISLASLPTVARVSGHLWQPQLLQPLTALILQPFGLLPAKWLPLALNLFSAALGALALALLVRSIELLVSAFGRNQAHHNRGSSSGPMRWIPPILAALLCGLQLSYWEHATSGTGEMIDLLIFAYIIRCIAEFRADERQAWLSRSAFLYGVGMANHWALIGYLPVYLIAIVRLKGLDIFDFRFLARMLLWTLAGLAFYLVLPTYHSLLAPDHVAFWPTLRSNLSFQKEMLLGIHRAGFTLLGLSAYLPFLIMSYRGDFRVNYDSHFSLIFGRAMTQLLFGFFLAVACWMALDPPFSPLGLGIGVPMLSYNYSWALAGGCCAGQLMLSGGANAPGSRHRRRSKRDWSFFPGLRMIALAILPSVVLVCLLWRNLGQIHSVNGPELHLFGRELCAELPKGKSVVLSDDIIQLLLLQSESRGSGTTKDPIFLSPASLDSLEYQRFLARKYSSRWPTAIPTNENQNVKPIPLVSRLAAHEPVIYLHPSFGYFFEIFTARPAGLVHYFEKLSSATIAMSPIPTDVAETNENFWRAHWTNTLQTLAGRNKQQIQQEGQETSWLSRQLKLPSRPKFEAKFLSAVYSRALNYWGVQMERRTNWEEARVWFERATELNPHNLSAQINLEFNQHRNEAEKSGGGLDWVEKRLPELTGRYRTWQSVLSDNGPVDDPTFLLASARVWLAGGNYHQAAAEFSRCIELGSGGLAPRLGLAKSHVGLRDFAGALQLIDAMQNSSLLADSAEQAEIRRLRAIATTGLSQTNTPDPPSVSRKE